MALSSPVNAQEEAQEPPIPPVEIFPSQEGIHVQWAPAIGSANFLQTSPNLLDWSYFPQAVAGTSAIRVLDFPFLSGSYFFRAVTRNYTGIDPESEDFDGDGLLTRDEMLTFGTDPLVADTDGNGIFDGAGDTDSDGIPDSDEILAGLDPNSASDTTSDLDRDGVNNLAEYLAGTNPANPDSDGDTLKDAWELLHQNPNLAQDPLLDADGDGLTARTEQIINYNPALADSDLNGIDDGAEDADQDGISNLQEQIAGTDPGDYFSGLSVATQVLAGNGQTIAVGESSSTITVKFTDSRTGQPLANAPVYVLRTCRGLIAGNSEARVNFTTQNNGEISFSFQTNLETLPGPSPIFIGLGSRPTGTPLAKVDLQITALTLVIPSPELSTATTKLGILNLPLNMTSTNSPSATFPPLLKIATIQVPTNTSPHKVTAAGQVVFASSMTFWNGSALQTIPSSGLYRIYDMNSQGQFVGDYRNGSYNFGNLAFHANLGNSSLRIVPSKVPYLHSYSEEELFTYGEGDYTGPPYWEWFSGEATSSYQKTRFSAIDENGKAYGMRDVILKYRLPDGTNPAYPYSSGTRAWRNRSVESAVRVPASFSIQNNRWDAPYGGFSKFYLYDSTGNPRLFPATDVEPLCVSPDGSKLIFSAVNFGSQNWSAGFNIPQSRPDLGPLTTLPTPIVAINDAGIIVGSFYYTPNPSYPHYPFVYANKTLVHLGNDQRVLGIANRASTEPIFIIGTKGIWVQKVSADTGLPLDPAEGTNIFEYKTYNQLDLNNTIGLSNLVASTVSKQGSTVVLQGTNATGQMVYVTSFLLPVEVVPDYNRDGKIDSADRGKVTDEKPWRWWVNDDDDVDSATGGDIPSSNSPDHANGQVDGMRDLIDFFPIHLDIKQALLVLPKSEYQYFIKHFEGGLKLIEFPSGEPDPSEDDLSRSPNSHLTNTSRASGLANYAVTPVTSAGVPLSNSYLNQAEDGKGLLLLEATKETTSPIQLEIRKGSQVIATINFPVKISKVENMYRHIDLTQVPLDYDGGSPGAAASPVGTKTVDPGSAYPDSLTNGKYFVFLHGFNVPVHRARGWNAEIFKRMHQMGSKARFVGITWTGATGIPIAGTPPNIGTAESSTDYHKAVFFAMQTGGAFAPALAFTQGADVTVAAHSLGNMVVGEAIQNGGLTPDRYYIINGAVATETYDSSIATDAERWAMTEAQWKPFGTIHQQRLYSSSWHTLFPASDNRSRLTWKNRFERVRRLGLSHNFYSSGDEVVQNPTSDTALGGIFAEGLARGAWGNQELMKGTDLASYVQSRYQGGWGFNFNPQQFPEYQGYVKPTFGGFRMYYPGETPADVPGGITDEQLETKPFFKPFKEFDLFSPTLGSAKAGELKVQRDVLGAGVPARSYAIAANPVPGLAGNHTMDELRTWPDSWPVENHEGESTGQWLHSDFRDVAINYLHKMYAKMIELGELNED